MRLGRVRYFAVATALLAVLAVASSAAASPYTLTYSGRLTETNGKPLSGATKLRIQFFRADAGGVAVPATIADFDVVLQSGLFNLAIDLSETDFHSVFNGTDPTWIQITDVTHGKSYPRQTYSAVPYALKVPIDSNTLAYDADGKLT